MTASKLDAKAWVYTGTGWLLLEDEANGYKLEASTREARQVSWRRQEIAGTWTEGTYTVHAVKENITETVGVWVRAATHAQLGTRIQVLLDAFSQLTYSMFWQEEGLGERWRCFCSDVQISTNRELQHARVALVKFSVPRLPSTTRYDGVVLPTGVVPA